MIIIPPLNLKDKLVTKKKVLKKLEYLTQKCLSSINFSTDVIQNIIQNLDPNKIHGPEAVTRRCSVKKVFLKISQNSQENTCARVFFEKKRLWHWCFPVNFVKFLRTPFLIEHLRWLLLTVLIKSVLEC